MKEIVINPCVEARKQAIKSLAILLRVINK